MVNHTALFSRREILIDAEAGYHVRELTAAQAEEIAFAFQTETHDELQMKALLCALSLYDKEGARVFEHTDTPSLRRICEEMPAQRLQRIADAAMALFEGEPNP